MQTYKQLYDRAVRMGKLRKDEYTKENYIDDINDLNRTLWTTIFQGVNGNKPSAVRTETFTVAGDLEYVAARTIKKIPIQKIVLDGCLEITQKTDKPENSVTDECFSFEYDDDEIRFDNSTDGEYKVYYESAVYTELTTTLYDADEEPTWMKDDFLPIFWSYPAFMNTDTRKQEMGDLYGLHQAQFRQYYSRTETLEENYAIPNDTYNQL